LRTLGIDPGLAIVGYGIIDSNIDGSAKVVDYGIITTSKTTTFPNRLQQIYTSISALIDKHKPDAVAVEELFFNNNVRSAINVSQARGVAILSAIQGTGNLYEYTPLQIKQALTGYGRAEKSQVQFMVKAILNLCDIPKPDDAADALAVALCHAQTNQVLSETHIR
jgi:crossover junction endodeoxyribonuclease RuvC